MPAAVIPLLIATAVGATVSEVVQGQQQAKAAKKAEQNAVNQQNQAIANLQNSQQAASTQAQNTLKVRQAATASSQDVFTSPLGIAGTAQVNKKTLLGN